MFTSTLRTRASVMAMSAMLFGYVAVAAAQQPTSLVQLLNRIPKSPATTQEADKMVVGMVDGKTQIPALATLKADLDAHTDAVVKIVATADAKIRARTTGGATVGGIDMVRAQTDQAYAKEVEAKMQAMSPQEQMALYTAMSGVGRGSVAVYDTPAVEAAAEAGEAYLDSEQTAARTATYQRRWAEVEKKVAAVNEKYAAKYPKMRLSGCDGEGAGRPECVAERARYGSEMMPLLYAHDAEVLQVEAAALEEERAALAKEVRAAEEHLLAAQYGAASQGPGNPTKILMLDQTPANNIKVLAAKFEEVVTRAALVTHCGPKYMESSSCYGGK